MMTAIVALAGITGTLSILALLGYAEMAHSAKANPDHWFHS